MNYLKSEHLKFKRTMANKLLFFIPLITAIFAWVIGGFLTKELTPKQAMKQVFEIADYFRG
mgnify:CR=1 FL=1